MEDQIKYNFASLIRINVIKFKYRVLIYMKKLYTIYEANYSPYFASLMELSGEEKPDPFRLVYYGYFATQDKELKEKI